MRTVLSLCVGVLLAGSIGVIACVGDEPTDPAKANAGEATGSCLPNGTCNTGLVCTAGVCAAPDAGGSSSGTTTSSGSNPSSSSGGGSTTSSSGGNTTSSSGSNAVCTFGVSTFPCDPGHTACFGDSPDCTLTGCGGGNPIPWQCDSPNQCGGLSCCLSTDFADTITDDTCNAGTVNLKAGITNGTVCGAEKDCADKNIQFCQENKQCPTGQRCVPIKFAGAGRPASLATFNLAICAK